MAGINPLDGSPLKPGQSVVTGDPLTGPRQTVVTAGQPVPPWITRLDVPAGDSGWVVTTYFDNGKPGGTFQPQRLPELAVSGTPWLLYLAILAVGIWGITKARGLIEWE